MAKYLDTTTVKKSTKFYKTNFSYDIKFIKDDVSTMADKAKKMSRQLNIHYRACIGPLIYPLYTRGFYFCSTQVRKVFIKSW